MQIIMSVNGGWCVSQELSMVCPECENSKFRIDDGEVWTGHNKREAFMIAECDKCGKKIDISVDVG